METAYSQFSGKYHVTYRGVKHNYAVVGTPDDGEHCIVAVEFPRVFARGSLVAAFTMTRRDAENRNEVRRRVLEFLVDK